MLERRSLGLPQDRLAPRTARRLPVDPRFAEHAVLAAYVVSQKQRKRPKQQPSKQVAKGTRPSVLRDGASGGRLNEPPYRQQTQKYKIHGPSQVERSRSGYTTRARADPNAAGLRAPPNKDPKGRAPKHKRGQLLPRASLLPRNTNTLRLQCGSYPGSHSNKPCASARGWFAGSPAEKSAGLSHERTSIRGLLRRRSLSRTRLDALPPRRQRARRRPCRTRLGPDRALRDRERGESTGRWFTQLAERSRWFTAALGRRWRCGRAGLPRPIAPRLSIRGASRRRIRSRNPPP